MGERKGIWSRKAQPGARDLFGQSSIAAVDQQRDLGSLGAVLASLWEYPYLSKYPHSGSQPPSTFGVKMHGGVICFASHAVSHGRAQSPGNNWKP